GRRRGVEPDGVAVTQRVLAHFRAPWMIVSVFHRHRRSAKRSARSSVAWAILRNSRLPLLELRWNQSVGRGRPSTHGRGFGSRSKPSASSPPAPNVSCNVPRALPSSLATSEENRPRG